MYVSVCACVCVCVCVRVCVKIKKNKNDITVYHTYITVYHTFIHKWQPANTFKSQNETAAYVLVIHHHEGMVKPDI